MFKLVTHSFKGGPGKSTIAANLAVALSLQGKRVGVMDMDLAGPGLHVIFGLSKHGVKYTLNDALMNKCTPVQAAIDLTRTLGVRPGRLIFIPAGYKTESIVSILQKGYELSTLRQAMEQISNEYSLDILILDTRPGIDESTLLTIGICDAMILLSRLDKQDIFGSGVTLEVAKALKKPVYLLANMIPPPAKRGVKERLERLFEVPVIGEIAYYPDVHNSLSSSVFILKEPEHEFSSKVRSIALTMTGLIENSERAPPRTAYTRPR